MKKILFTFLFLMFFVKDSVAEIIHVVARGESIESIADKYGIILKITKFSPFLQLYNVNSLLFKSYYYMFYNTFF